MQRTYSRSKLVAYIVDSLESGQSATKLAREVAAYLIEVGKTSDLVSIMRDAQELRATRYGVVELTAASAHPLEKSSLNDVEAIAKRQYPGASQTTIHQKIDPTIIGGANLTFPHASLDLTIRAKLNQLREATS